MGDKTDFVLHTECLSHIMGLGRVVFGGKQICDEDNSKIVTIVQVEGVARITKVQKGDAGEVFVLRYVCVEDESSKCSSASPMKNCF